MASALCRPRCALKLIERVPQQIIYLRKRNKSQDPLLWTKSKIWPCECSTRAAPCKVDPLTHPDEQLTRPTVNLKPKSSHPPFFNIWKNQIKKKCGGYVCMFMVRELAWLWNNNHLWWIFLAPEQKLPFATLGIFLSVSPSFFLSFFFSDTRTRTRTHTPGVWGEGDKAVIIRLGPIRREILRH